MKYVTFVNNIKRLGKRKLDYCEIHHIVPKCMGGDDSPENLIKLTLREHFITHAMLARENDHIGIQSAFIQMCHKRVGRQHFKINSRIYESLKQKLYESLSDYNSGMLTITVNGVKRRITSEEYKSNDDYVFHTTGMVYAINIHTGLGEYITSKYYQNNKDLFELPISQSKFTFISNSSDEIIKMTKLVAAEKNKRAGFKKYSQQLNSQLKLKDGSTVPATEYNPSIHTHMNTGKLAVFDSVDNVHKSISCSEYTMNKDRYVTSTKGKVLAIDEHGNNVLVTQDEFNSGNYSGQTKGLVTMYDTETKKFVQLTKEESLKSRYIGPASGKVNVYDAVEQVSKQISKATFDAGKNTRYFGGGVHTVKLICDLTTNIEKCIIHDVPARLANNYTLLKPLNKTQLKILQMI